MRDQKTGGVIQQITSIGGQRGEQYHTSSIFTSGPNHLKGVPTFSIYCASKWAVEGFTEAISHEVKPEWNIKFTCIEPGGFRTDWAGRSMDFGEKKHPAYDHIDAKQAMGKRHGTQAGDPAKAAQALLEIVEAENPPVHLVLGTDALGLIRAKLQSLHAEISEWEHLTRSTDFEAV